MTPLSVFFRARLSRKIISAVFLSIIAIEFVLLIPSFLQRENEILNHLTELSSAQIDGILLPDSTLGPRIQTETLNRLEKLTKQPKPLFQGGALYTSSGILIKTFGKPPELNFETFQREQKTKSLNRRTYNYDVVKGLQLKDGEYVLIISHDAIVIREEFYSFNSRILGLVLIVSIAVTASTAIVLKTLIIDPILKLRIDLTKVGDAVHNEKSLPKELESTQNVQNDELGEVMVAFSNMVDDIAVGLEEIEASQKQLMHTEQLVHSAKMAGLERIVAGIAHEINNPLGVVYGNIHHLNKYVSQVLLALNYYRYHFENQTQTEVAKIVAKQSHISRDIDFPTEEDLEFIIADLPELCTSMKSGAERVRDIVLSLRDFARLDEVGCKVIDINDELDSTLNWLTYRLESNTRASKIDIDKKYSNLPLVECDPKQMNQVFLNILMNSIDALEDSQCKVERPQLQIQTSTVDDACVSVSFTDNGMGIPIEIQSKVFDPFFTTKTVGNGKGLGLALVDRIVTEEHKGHVKLQSSPAGTQITIILPVKFSTKAIA